MNNTELNKPCLVQCGQGLSVLNTLQYQGRFLYSKYSPDKAVKELVKNLKVLDGTVFLIQSPALWYGCQELIQKLGNNCIICAFEADPELYEFSRELLKTQNFSKDIHFYSINHLQEFDDFLRKEVEKKFLKRVIPLDFSAGVQFNRKLYDTISRAAEEIPERFWKNRITLQKFGKLYSKNFFLNLPKLTCSSQLNSLAHTIDKPIFIAAAGESLDQIFYCQHREALIKKINSSCFVIAVDAALSPLLEMGIKVDAAALMEGQFVISKAFIGCQKKFHYLIQDLCARPDIASITGAQPLLYLSKFSEAAFLNQVIEDGLISTVIPPLGSVGLLAVEAALMLAKDKSVKIFTIGLDFSYSCGKTHGKGCPAHNNQLMTSSRFKSIENYEAAFTNTLRLKGKNGADVITTPALLSYSKNFSAYSKRPDAANRLFDLADTGLPNGLPYMSLKDFLECDFSPAEEINENSQDLFQENFAEKSEKIKKYLLREKTSLEIARDLLTKGDESNFRNSELSLEEQISALLKNRDYLYLHFPDGTEFKMEISFLKRIRAELDSFIKIQTQALSYIQ